MNKFKSMNDAVAIIAISFSDGTNQIYSGKISEIETYREDNTHYFPLGITINSEMILKLRFPQGFISTVFNENTNQLPSNTKGD